MNNITIEAMCGTCTDDLQSYIVMDRGGIELFVTTCEKCLCEAHDEGMKEQKAIDSVNKQLSSR